MKARVKQTGKIIDIVKIDYLEGDTVISVRYHTEDGYPDYYDFESLKELNDTLEDYSPKEPLIKDEKIRKAVRAWAEANDLLTFKVVNEHFDCFKIIGYGDHNISSRIEFKSTIAHANKNQFYTITELCGEEE